MRLHVGTNWDPALIDELSAIPEVTELYGCMARHVVGHGRPAASVPEVSMAQVGEHVRLLHERGLSFSYLLNAPSLGGRQFHPTTMGKVEQHLDEVVSAGVDSITVSLASLVEFAKRRYPELKVYISHNSLVRTLDQALRFQDMGADMITLHQTAVRNFRLIERLTSRLTVPLQVICTIDCVPGCPNSIGYHMAGTSVLSSDRATLDLNTRHASAWCFTWCHLKKLTRPEEILKGGFIRPEDLAHYEAVGICDFKLDTRVLTTPQVVDRARAFANRRWDGDLKRLYSIFSLGYRTRRGTQMGGGKASDMPSMSLSMKQELPNDPRPVASPTDPESLEAAAFFSLASTIDFDKLLHTNARGLDGFLDRFIKDPCPPSCSSCTWCKRFTANTLAWNEDERKRLVAILRDYRSWLAERR